VAALGLLAASTLLAANISTTFMPDAETISPAGDYRVAWLTLEKGWAQGADLPLFLGLRGGRGVTAWYAAPPRSDCHRMWVDEISVRQTGLRLQGQIRGRMVKVWAPVEHVGDYVYSLEAEVREGKVSGNFSGKFTLKAKGEQTQQGKLTGKLSGEAEIKKNQALPPGKDWPWYYGAGSAFRGPDCAAQMVDDLRDSRPVWKAEEPLPCMWGKGPDGRYKNRVCIVGVDGGASSPVVAGGLVYCFYFRPTGPLANDKAGKQPADEAQLRAEAAKFTASPLGQKAYLDWHRTRADDILVAFDAATGQTVWRTTLPDRSLNHQTHKWRGYNPTPLVARGAVYAVNYTSRLYALDAETGKLLWEYAGLAGSFDTSAVGPVLAGGVLAMAAPKSAVGLDPATGRELWRASSGNLLLWRATGGDRLLVCSGIKAMTISCLDPKSGKPLWKTETPFWGVGDVYPIIEGDFLLGYNATKAEKAGEADFSKDTEVLCCRLKDDGLEKIWSSPAPYPAVDKLALTVANDHVYVDGSKETFCLKLSTGEKVGVAKAGGARTQIMFAADDRVFIQPEGRHGGQSFFMLEGNPKNLRMLPTSMEGKGNHDLPGQWFPPHVPDTAYANQPVAYPLVDGRLFVRGHEGLYCYDLRRSPAQRKADNIKP
jgi:outer membrane protein assembly factor BamB